MKHEVVVNLRDINLTKSQDFTKCANCYEDLVLGKSKAFEDILSVTGKMDVNILEALTDLFELPKKNHFSSVRLDEKYLCFCFTCWKLLENLYTYHIQLVLRSQPPSFLNSIMKFQGAFKRLRDPPKSAEEVIQLPSLKVERESDNVFSEVETRDQNSVRRKRRINYLRLSRHGLESDDVTEPLDALEGSILEEPNFETVDLETRGTSEDSENSGEGMVGVGQPNQSDDASSEQNSEIPTRMTRRKIGGTKQFRCEICSDNFTRNDRLRRHMSCHSKNNFLCKICNAGFTMEAKRDAHMRKHNPDYVNENVVIIESSADQSGETAFIKKLGKGFQECKICGKVSQRSLLYHVASHKGDADREIICEVCGTSHKNKIALKNHQLIHGNELHHRCKLCGQTFTRKQHLKEHDAIKHGNQPKKFVCKVPDCNAAFHRVRNLKEHSKKHGNIKYACELGCGALFTYKYNRKTHQERYCTLATTRKDKRRRKKKQQQQESFFETATDDETQSEGNQEVDNVVTIASTSSFDTPDIVSNDQQIRSLKSSNPDSQSSSQNIQLIQIPKSVAQVMGLTTPGMDLPDGNLLYQFLLK